MLLLLSLVKEDNSRISATNKKDLGIIMLAMQTQERFKKLKKNKILEKFLYIIFIKSSKNPGNSLESTSLLPLLLMKENSNNAELLIFMEVSRQRNRQLCRPKTLISAIMGSGMKNINL